ncbi:MAG: hypothetical protein ACE5KE_09100 [Methanosarcinales archaeon]
MRTKTNFNNIKEIPEYIMKIIQEEEFQRYLKFKKNEKENIVFNAR